MVDEAERYKAEDEAHRSRIEARNKLENYAFSVQSAVRDYEDKLSSDDQQKVKSEVDQVLSWVESNQLAEKEEYEHKMEELQKICSPIMAKLHRAASGGQQQSTGGPTVEEMD